MSKLFSTLKQIDNNDYQFYNELTDDEKRKIGPYILLKWLSFSNDAERIKLINETANVYMFSLYKYPELMSKVLAASGTGKEEFYKFISPSKKVSTKLKSISVILKYHNISKDEANYMLDLYDMDEVIDMAESLGLHDYIKDIKREFK